MKLNSIKKNEEFRVVYRKGKSIANKYLVLYYYKNNTTENRLGISVSKKVGNAVVRNKIKRRIKECYRDCEFDLKGYDLVVIARIKSNTADYKDFDKSLKHLLRKI